MWKFGGFQTNDGRNNSMASYLAVMSEVHVLLVDHDSDCSMSTTKMLEFCSYKGMKYCFHYFFIRHKIKTLSIPTSFLCLILILILLLLLFFLFHNCGINDIKSSPFFFVYICIRRCNI